MAFIGTPLDTRNTFQSLAGKRFNGDGSTTAFTLDVAPSSTLDLEVFVGNVRQDPNSAYTLSGTTLTFTGAPPSGTNNIYVVHQAKSVGTIDVPSGGVKADNLNSAVLTGQTDIGGAIADADLFLVDDGAGGTLRKTAASRLKTYIGTSPITALNNATENELVTVGSTTTELDAEAKLISDGSGIIIRNAAVGTATSGKADMLVIEGNASGDTAGMSILTANDEFGVIHFGDGDDVDVGKIEYSHGSNFLRFYVNGSETMRIRDDGEVLIGGTASTNSKVMVTQANNQALARFHNTDSSATATLFKIKCDNSTGGDYISFNIDKAGSSVLNIEGDGDVKNTNNSYGSISDERIKKDITDANSQWDDIKALKIKNYKLKTDNEAPTQLGVIAQDLETDGMNGLVKESRPEAYLVNAHSDFGTLEDGTADNGAIPITDKDDKITGYEKVFTEGQKVKSVKYSVLYMKAIKALQESMTRIETLEAKVKTLEEG